MTADARAFLSGEMNHARAAVRDGNTIRSRLSPIGEREPVGALLRRNFVHHAARAAFRERQGGQWRVVKWDGLLADVASFGRFLTARGIGPGDRVAALSPNRSELLVAELATMGIGAVYTPIFAGYAADQIDALLAHAEPAALVLAGSHTASVSAPDSARVVLILAPNELGTGSASRTLPFHGALEEGRAGIGHDGGVAGWLDKASRVDPDDPALMMYTSGTSGPLKGVVLTHDNILSQQRALSAIWSITTDDRLLSYLPWHHSFGGIFEKYAALYQGAELCMDDSLGKDFDRLLANWKDVQPTIYFSVPKIYQQLVAQAQAHPEDERLIFHDGLRFVFTAAAPLPGVISAYFAAKGIPVLEGWGLTETSPCCTLTDLGEPRAVPGLVGYPIPGVEVGVAPDGEILVRGPNVMRGYFRSAEATERALPSDGWFHTGDLGELSGAALKLVSRKDRVFKLLNAEKVIPTVIENRLAGMNPYIRHVIVTGSGRESLAALIFPDYFRIEEEFGADRARAAEMVKASLRETVLAFNREHPVKYERIQAVVVISRELSVEEGELTPSLKVRVSNVLDRADSHLEAVYDPQAGCDCRFLRTVMRIAPDDRPCFAGLPRTLDRCHECGDFVFGGEMAANPG